MAPLFTLISFALAWLAPFVRSYGIDSSCEDADFIEASADSAIAMAQAALDAINNEPRDSNVERLLDLLFRPTNALSESDEALLIRSVTNVFRGAAGLGTRTAVVAPDQNEATASQVNIYCGLDRVKKRTGDGQYVDTSIAMILEGYDDGVFEACNSLSGTLAQTWAPHHTDQNNLLRYLPSQVTICPWFYQWSHVKTLAQWNELSAKAVLAKGAIPAATLGWPFTDAVNLLDKVLLHEFTHTTACGGMIDVEMATGGAPRWNVGYGWNAATNLAKQEDNNLQKTPARNSDTYALFASGVRLLSEDPRLYIKDNGYVTQEEQQRASKRDVPVELQWKQTPAAFEGFITRIRAERAAATMLA